MKSDRPVKVCHLTSAHPPEDVRIFHKECVSLSRAGFEVFLVAPAEKDYKKNGVSFLAIQKESNRLKRMTSATRMVYKRALESDADIFHFHDPELLPVGRKLKKHGKVVIYDVHEDLPRQILSKAWISKPIRKTVAFFTEKFENASARKMDAVITATPFIRNRFLQVNPTTVDINNYPLLNEEPDRVVEKKESAVCYAGGLHEHRGITKLVEAAGLAGVKLKLAGNYAPEGYHEKLMQLPGWHLVEDYGFLGREQVKSFMTSSVAGLVTLPPLINYVDALPVKMFEYMAAGIPVIASDFPLWRGIIEEADCGFLVDPMDPSSIAKAIRKVMADPEAAEEMGRNGKKAILEKFNWQIEERKLITLYQQLVKKRISQ